METEVPETFSEPYQEIWHELNGRSIYPVVTEAKDSYQSISKVKTFTPPSTNETFIFAQLSKNLENACIKARRYMLGATRLVIFLRRQDFSSSGIEIKLNLPTALPVSLMEPLRERFDDIFRPNTLYRQTGVVLAGLMPSSRTQYSLFDDVTKIEKLTRIHEVIDAISSKYGKHTLQHGASLPTKQQSQHEGERGDVPVRRSETFKGENEKAEAWAADVAY